MQVKILGCLAEHKTWPGGWVWDTYSHTDKVISSMVKHNLVRITGKDRLGYNEYRITKKGIHLVNEQKLKSK